MTDDSAEATPRRERLARRRKTLGLTQEALADLLEVERSTVVRWERGQTEPVHWMRPKLAKALRVSADRLEELLAGGSRLGEPPGSAAGRGDGTGLTVPRQLPAAVPDFTGREAELRVLTRVLDDAGAISAGTVLISAIGGTAGVGKTALALHWAHQVAHRFPDGQLHVNLRGFDPTGTPATAAEAIGAFLGALGVPPERIPPSTDAQAGMYRSLLADKRMLIVLDNARDEQQVRPLLPASPGSLVTVTSRNQLNGLAATHGALLLSLDPLTHGEAVQLLTARVGASRSAAEPEVVAEIACLCAHLPLALAVAAARAAGRPGFPLAALSGDLRDTADRLDVLDAGDPAASVRAVFSWSYSQLSAEAARMFRLLGQHPGPDIGVRAAASLAAAEESRARHLLRELVRDCLITEHAPDRYAFHDLLRAYAVAQARDCDSEDDRAAAVGRVLDHYLHTADSAARILLPGKEPVVLAPPQPGAIHDRPANYPEAMAWFEAEHHVLSTAVALAAGSSGFGRHAWQLAWAMASFLQTRGHCQEWLTNQRTALEAATHVGDLIGRAMSTRLLAAACAELGDYEQALSYQENNLELYRRIGNRLGEAKVHYDISSIHVYQRRYPQSLTHAECALRIYRGIGHKAGEAAALNAVGWIHCCLGDYQRARELCEQAVALCVEVGDRLFEGRSLDSLGYSEYQLGNFSEAAARYQRALTIAQEVGERRGEAEILTHLGDTHLATGDLPRARNAWRKALAVWEELRHPNADDLRAKLASTED